MAALRWIGDLDHPFYDDERQRYVWYEASAIGFQLALMLQYTLAGAAMLIGGRAALPYAIFGLAPILITTFVVAGYTNSRGAPYMVSGSNLRRGRGKAAVFLAVLYIAGVLRVGLDTGDGGATDLGSIIAIAGIVGFAGGIAVAVFQKRLRRTDADGDIDDLDRSRW
jgi:hypothetical protein